VRPSRIPAQLRTDVFRGSDAVDAGLLSRRSLAGRSWRRLYPDVYVHHDVPVTHELRAHGAAVLLPAAVVSGPSAAVLWGLPLVDAAADVEVTLPPAAPLAAFPVCGCGGQLFDRGMSCRDAACR
jgi:hypothetical protein